MILGRIDCVVSIYEDRLEEDWHNDANQLKNVDADTLSRYMPRLLAGKSIRSWDQRFSPF